MRRQQQQQHVHVVHPPDRAPQAQCSQSPRPAPSPPHRLLLQVAWLRCHDLPLVAKPPLHGLVRHERQSLVEVLAVQLLLGTLGLLLCWFVVDWATNHQMLLWPWQRFVGVACSA